MSVLRPLSAVAALALLPATAGAAQTTTLTYQCKYPLLGIRPVTVQTTLALPGQIAPGEATGPFQVDVSAAAHAMGVLYAQTVDNVASVDGTATLVANVVTPTGELVPGSVTAPLGAASLIEPVADPLNLTGSTQGPSLSFDTTGSARIDLDGLGLNLRLLDTAGNPIDLPPITRDIDGFPTTDSDGDPHTFDLSCTLSPGQERTLATITVDDGPLPSTTPEPSVTPTPLPPTPIEPPNPANSVPAVPAGATSEPYQCKWPLAGVRQMTVSSVLPDPSSAGTAPLPFEVWLRNDDIDVYKDTIDDLAGYRGAVYGLVTAQTPAGPKQIAVVAGLDSYEYGAADTGYPFFHATGSIDPSKIPAGTTALTLTAITPSLRVVDGQGQSIILPPLTRGVDGGPVPDPDGDPETITLSCIPGVVPPPTPSPTPVPTPGPGLYALSGRTTLSTLTRGTLPLTGSLTAQPDPSTGSFAGDLTLNDTQGRLTALGFIPVAVTIGFVPSGPATGQLTSSSLSVQSRVRIKIKSAKAFGAIPLVSGNGCQTKQLTDLSLTNAGAFTPATGGTIAGSYAISDMNGCGVLNGLISPSTAGSGNAMTLAVTPKPAGS